MPIRGITKEEAKEAIREAYGNSEYTDEIIKALEQEPFMNKACVSSNVCKHDKAVALDKIRAEIKQLRNFRAENYDLEQYCACFDARIIFRDDVFEILDKYKTESEG